jgi:hypothetical protein
MVSVGKPVYWPSAALGSQLGQISSHLGLQEDDNVTQSILADEKAMTQVMSEIIASGDDRVYKLRGDEANSFLNLLQEVGKSRFISGVVSKYVVSGLLGTVPSLGGG